MMGLVGPLSSEPDFMESVGRSFGGRSFGGRSFGDRLFGSRLFGSWRSLRASKLAPQDVQAPGLRQGAIVRRVGIMMTPDEAGHLA